MLRGRLLIVEDDALYREVLTAAFSADYETQSVGSVSELRAALHRRFDVVLLDDQLADGYGTDHLQEINDRLPFCRIVICTAGQRPRSAEIAFTRGVQAFLVKPVDREELTLAVARALEAARHATLVAATRERVEKPALTPDASAEHIARRAAQSRSTILISGETGAGKTVLARQLHEWSERGQGPFVALNCASIPEALAEAELFGSERGAYTGAIARMGAFELASTGTLFLDEVAELPQAIQAKLLTVVEDGLVRRVGGTVPLPVDTRLVAASHRDLHDEVRAGRFRSDLLYRLDVVTIRVPPLREQPERIASLVVQLLSRLAPGRAPELAAGELERLQRYPWPGNVRELRNVLERALIFDGTGTLSPSLYLNRSGPGVSQPSAEPAGAVPGQRLEEMEVAHIRAVLARCDGNRSAAARALGIGPATLRRKLDLAERRLAKRPRGA